MLDNKSRFERVLLKHAMSASPPDLTRLHARALKRHLSYNEEQRGRRQAQFICGVPYDGIIEGALRAFMPLVNACMKDQSGTYEQVFCGRNSHGEFDRNMRLTVHAQYVARRPGHLDGDWYRFWVSMNDAHGRVRVQERLGAAGEPLVEYIRCLGRARTYEELAEKQQTLRAELVRVLYPWLVWFGREFKYS